MAGLAEQVKKGDELKNQGNVAYKAKKFDEAIALYDQAIEANPYDMIYHNNKAAVYVEMEQYDKAIDTCKSVLERRYEINGVNKEGATFEKVAKVMVRLGGIYTKLKRFPEAKEMYDRALTEDNNRNTRNALREMKDIQEKWEKEQYMDPAKANEHREAGNTHFKNQQWAEAKKEYDEAIKRNPDDAKVYSNRAAALTKLLAYPDALRDLDHCLKLDPKFVKAYSRKGTIHFFTKEYNKALEDYALGLAIDPENAECKAGREAVLNKVREQNQVGDKPDEEQIRRAMEDPEIQQILKDPKMNQILKEMQENPQTAMQAIQEDPQIASAIQKLMLAGILKIGNK